MISYARTKIIAHAHTHLHKIQLRYHCTPIHTHTIIHKMILSITYIHKIPPHTHHTPLHTYNIIHKKILTHHPVTQTIKYYSYNKLSQSPQLPRLCHNTLRKFHIRNTSRNGPRHLCTHRGKSKSYDTKTWYNSRN